MSRAFKEEFRESMNELRFQTEDKDRLRRQLVWSQNRISGNEGLNMKKWTLKKIAAAVAVCVLMTGVTVFAAGKISTYFASSKSGYDYKTTAEINAEKDAKMPEIPEKIGNGFLFDGGNKVLVKGVDDAGNTIGKWEDIHATYKAGDKTITLSLSMHPGDKEGRSSTETRNIDGISVRYDNDEYLYLPDENVQLDLTTQERLKNDDHFFVSYGSEKEETGNQQSVSFKRDGVDYLVYTSDDMSKEDLFQIATELLN